MARLFVAVVPPAAVVERLRAVDRPDDLGVRWVPEHQWHATLRFLGDVDRDEAVAALGAAAWAPAFVELGPAVGRLGDRVICLPASGLDQLAAAVVEVTEGLGAPPARVPFRGHLTLGRTRDDHIAVSVVGLPFGARFVADRLLLLDSRQGPDGHHHEVVAEWSPRGDADPV